MLFASLQPSLWMQSFYSGSYINQGSSDGQALLGHQDHRMRQSCLFHAPKISSHLRPLRNIAKNKLSSQAWWCMPVIHFLGAKVREQQVQDLTGLQS